MRILNVALAATPASFPRPATAQKRAGYVEAVQPDGFQSWGGECSSSSSPSNF